MKRRDFLKATLAAGAVGLLSERVGHTMEPTTAKREYYTLQRFLFATGPQQERYLAYLQKAWIPAARRQGCGPIGVFTPADAKDAPTPLDVYVLAPFASMDAFAGFETRLSADAEYKTAGAFLTDLPSSDPPYARIESRLLHAFASYPTLHVPREAAQQQGRTFELRTYESHSARAGRKKIEMFDRGETDIFVRGGFQPVFFGENMIGPDLPALTYMVTYADGTPRDAYWSRFGADPEKARLFAMPEYADKEIVSKIHSLLLRPAACSQV